MVFPFLFHNLREIVKSQKKMTLWNFQIEYFVTKNRNTSYIWKFHGISNRKKLKIGKSEMKHVIHYYFQFLFHNLEEIVKSQNNFFPSKPNHSLHCGQCHIFVCWGVPICHKSGLILSFVSKHDLHILCPHFSKQTNSGIEMPHDRQCWAL